MESLAAWFCIAAFATWRATYFLAFEEGPWRLVARLRETAGALSAPSPFGCFYCLSLWVALPFALALGEGTVECLMLWLGLSGVACLVDRISGHAEPPLDFYEGDDQEEHHALLRRFAPRNDPPAE